MEHTMQQWHLFKHTAPSEDRLAQEAAHAGDEVNTLPEGAKHDLLLKRARQAETAAHINEWLASRGLRPPT
jgi:hypothetical protein